MLQRAGLSPRATDDKIIALHGERLLYFYIPKVACSTLKTFCGHRLGYRWDESDSEAVHRLRFPGARKSEVAAGKYGDYLRFAVVRNPWARLYSCFRNKVLPTPERSDRVFVDGVYKGFVRYNTIRAGMSFAEFVRAVAAIPDAEADEHFRSQHHFLDLGGGRVELELLATLETLPEDFEELCRRLGLADVPPLGREMRSGSGASLAAAIDAESDTLIRRRYAADIELFRYPAAGEPSALPRGERGGRSSRGEAPFRATL